MLLLLWWFRYYCCCFVLFVGFVVFVAIMYPGANIIFRGRERLFFKYLPSQSVLSTPAAVRVWATVRVSGCYLCARDWNAWARKRAVEGLDVARVLPRFSNLLQRITDERLSYGSGTGPGQVPVRVRYRSGSGTIPGQVPVRVRYHSPGQVPFRVRYHSGSGTGPGQVLVRFRYQSGLCTIPDWVFSTSMFF